MQRFYKPWSLTHWWPVTWPRYWWKNLGNIIGHQCVIRARTSGSKCLVHFNLLQSLLFTIKQTRVERRSYVNTSSNGWRSIIVGHLINNTDMDCQRRCGETHPGIWNNCYRRLLHVNYATHKPTRRCTWVVEHIEKYYMLLEIVKNGKVKWFAG